MDNNKQMAVNPVAKMEVVYNTLGQEIKLNANIVRQYLTKGNGNVTDQEILQFISICKYQQLNPFLNEAYLVKYKNNSGGEDNAVIVVGKEAFMKRAEGCEGYRGFLAGVILKRGTEVVYEEGEFMRDGDVLLGGWAEVHRNDRDYPVKAFVNLKDYDKKRSTWNTFKCTMIRKVALVHALREAFPAQLGALYTIEERRTEEADYEDVTNEQHILQNANKEDLPEEEEPKQRAATNVSGSEPQNTKPTTQPTAEAPMPDVFAGI